MDHKRIGILLAKNVLKLLSKSVLIPLELTAVVAADAVIEKKVFRRQTLLISNEEMKDILR